VPVSNHVANPAQRGAMAWRRPREPAMSQQSAATRPGTRKSALDHAPAEQYPIRVTPGASTGKTCAAREVERRVGPANHCFTHDVSPRRARRQIAVSAPRSADMANMTFGAPNRRARGGRGGECRKLSKPMADMAARAHLGCIGTPRRLVVYPNRSGRIAKVIDASGKYLLHF
jgi:hypothetical protein